jgi:hypothetical protein
MMHTPSGGVQMPQLGLQQTCPVGQRVGPHTSPPGGSQAVSMQLPPRGAQIPQLGLQQYSSRPQYDFPQASPWSGTQYSRVQPCPSGTQRLQLSLQQYSPGPHIAWLHGCSVQTSSEHLTSGGRQTPPQRGQQIVPSRQSIAAQGLSLTGTQTPAQSAPPALGSQSSPTASTHVNPSGHGIPAMPPHMPPGVPI